MIILLGFKTYDEADTEYQVTGSDLLRLAQLLGHSDAGGVVSANVTFYHRGLTDEICNENLQETRRELADRSLELFPST